MPPLSFSTVCGAETDGQAVGRAVCMHAERPRQYSIEMHHTWFRRQASRVTRMDKRGEQEQERENGQCNVNAYEAKPTISMGTKKYESDERRPQFEILHIHLCTFFVGPFSRFQFHDKSILYFLFLQLIAREHELRDHLYHS